MNSTQACERDVRKMWAVQKINSDAVAGEREVSLSKCVTRA